MPENEELFEEMSIPETEAAFAGHSCFSAVSDVTEREAEPTE